MSFHKKEIVCDPLRLDPGIIPNRAATGVLHAAVMDVAEGAARRTLDTSFCLDVTEGAAARILHPAVADVSDCAARGVFDAFAVEIAHRAARGTLDASVRLDIGDGAAGGVFDTLGAGFDPHRKKQGCGHKEQDSFHLYKF